MFPSFELYLELLNRIALSEERQQQLQQQLQSQQQTIKELKESIEQCNNLEQGMTLFDHIITSLNVDQQAPSTSPPDDVGEIPVSPRSEEVLVDFGRTISCTVVITPPRVKVLPPVDFINHGLYTPEIIELSDDEQ